MKKIMIEKNQKFQYVNFLPKKTQKEILKAIPMECDAEEVLTCRICDLEDTINILYKQ